MNVKVCAVVVTYNKLEMLKHCISNIEQQKYAVNDIVVVDNNSTDGTREYLGTLKNITPIYLNENIGGAGGFESGLQYFYEHTESDYCWIMDDDTFPDNNSLAALMKVDELLNGNYGFLSSHAYWKDGTPCNMNRPSLSENWSSKIEDNLIQINLGSFVSLLTSRKIIREVGLPIGEFFIWGDDFEFTRRISNIKNSYYVPQSRVLHNMNENKKVDIITDDYQRIPRYFYSFRNRYFSERKRSFKLGFKTVLRSIKLIFMVLIYSKDHKFSRVKQIIKGQFAGFVFNPTIKKV